MGPPRSRILLWAAILLLAMPLLVLLGTAYSEAGFYSPVDVLRILATEPESSLPRAVLKLRLLRALCAAGVGGSLALAGAMMQGLFRNPMAEPGLLGVSSGAALGAVVGISVLGGYGPSLTIWKPSASENLAAQAGSAADSVGLALIPLLSIIGAFLVAVTVYRLATRHGRISIPALLLTGLAVNAIVGSLMAALQVLLLQDWQVSRAIVAWGFGTLDDRTPLHLLIVAIGAAAALLSIPFVGLELDLLAGGEEDSAALGANPGRVKAIVLACAAVATASAVSVCGQIAFVGLLVPQLVRMVVGPHHRALLPISFLAGAVLLLLVVVLQHGFCPFLAGWAHQAGSERLVRLCNCLVVMRPGVLTSLVGGPFFLYLLVRQVRLGMW